MGARAARDPAAAVQVHQHRVRSRAGRHQHVRADARAADLAQQHVLVDRADIGRIHVQERREVVEHAAQRRNVVGDLPARHPLHQLGHQLGLSGRLGHRVSSRPGIMPRPRGRLRG